MAKMQLRILTSDSVKLDEPVDFIIMRCLLDEMGDHSAMGEIGVLPGHMPMSGVLGINPLRIYNDGTERVAALFGGVVTVKDNVVTMMTEKALWPDEIDAEKAKAEHDEAEAAINAVGDSNGEALRLGKIAMLRASVQMEVSQVKSGRK